MAPDRSVGSLVSVACTVAAVWTTKLEAHEKENPQITLRTLDGRIIPDGTPIKDLLIQGGIAKLELHPDAPTAHAKSA